MRSRDGRGGLWRSRWAAIGAAVAVTFGAGGLVAVNAADEFESTTVMIDPARILDTRENLGLVGPFERGTSRKLQVTGSVQTATGVRQVVPVGATGVLLNVTVSCVNRPGVGCQGGWLAVRPGDVSGQTQTSSLNFLAGDIVPNSVQVALPSAGNIDVVYGPYVPGAQVDVVIDVVGYTTADLLDYLVWAMPFAVSARSDSLALGLPADVRVVSVQLTAPVTGNVTVNTSTTASTIVGGDGVMCSITDQPLIDVDYLQQWRSAGPDGDRGVLAGTRTFFVGGGLSYTFELRCSGIAGPTLVLNDSVITAIFTPAP